MLEPSDKIDAFETAGAKEKRPCADKAELVGKRGGIKKLWHFAGGIEMKTNSSSAPIADVGVSALRGLSSAGYFTPEQLVAMESILTGKSTEPQTGKHWLTIIEACRHARLSRTTLWKYCHAGRLTVHRIGGRRMIEQSELDAFMMTDQKEVVIESAAGKTG